MLERYDFVVFKYYPAFEYTIVDEIDKARDQEVVFFALEALREKIKKEIEEVGRLLKEGHQIVQDQAINHIIKGL